MLADTYAQTSLLSLFKLCLKVTEACRYVAMVISGFSMGHQNKNNTMLMFAIFLFSACPIAALAGGLCLSLEGHYTLLH